MLTNREVYFSLLKENNRYLHRSIIVELLCDINTFESHSDLYRHFDDPCKNYEKLIEYAAKVKEGIPYQHVLGYSFFLGHKVKVNNEVLIPRQETEQLVVDTILYIKKNFKDTDSLIIGDICTGSGAIALSLKKEFPNAKVYASDISPEALNIAKQNFKDLDITVYQGDMAEPFVNNKVKLDVLLCNPPYIENISNIDEQVYKYEPHLALIAQPNYKYYKALFEKVPEIMNKDHFYIALEIEEDMQQELLGLIGDYFPECAYRFHHDIYNKLRFLYIIK